MNNINLYWLFILPVSDISWGRRERAVDLQDCVAQKRKTSEWIGVAIDWWKLYYLTNNDAKLILNNELSTRVTTAQLNGSTRHATPHPLIRMIKVKIPKASNRFKWIYIVGHGIKIRFCLASFGCHVLCMTNWWGDWGWRWWLFLCFG